MAAQCEAETRKGQPCARDALPGAKFCVHHEPSLTAEEQGALAYARRKAGVLTKKRRNNHRQAFKLRAEHLSRILNKQDDPRADRAHQEFSAIEWALGVLGDTDKEGED